MKKLWHSLSSVALRAFVLEAALLALGCAPHAQTSADSTSSRIVGKWLQIQTVHPFSYQFNADGTGWYSDILDRDDSIIRPLRWTLSGNNISIKYGAASISARNETVKASFFQTTREMGDTDAYRVGFSGAVLELTPPSGGPWGFTRMTDK